MQIAFIVLSIVARIQPKWETIMGLLCVSQPEPNG